MNNLQAFVDAIGESGRLTRSKYHLTLGGLITLLKQHDPAVSVVFDNGSSPGSPHSYRGYYSDLSFGGGDAITAGALLEKCERALGATFEGYKGGDFVMREDTPLWCASWGNCGSAIIGGSMTNEGVLELTTKRIGD